MSQFKAIVIFIIFVITSLFSAEEKAFYSESLKKVKRYSITLPSNYDEKQCFPVIYFLHGAAESHKSYGSLENVVDSLQRYHNLSGYIVAKPNGNVGRFVGSFYTNSELFGNYEDYIVHDFISHVESNYKACATKSTRVIMGHSMGGYGAMKIALKNPGMFRAVVSHNGPLDLTESAKLMDDVIEEMRTIHPETVIGDVSFLTYCMSGAFSPNPKNKTFGLDFPINHRKKVNHGVLKKWLEHNPSSFIANKDDYYDLAIYFDAGKTDKYNLHEFNLLFSRKLSEIGVKHRFDVFQGGHTTYLEERFAISLAFVESQVSQNSSPLLSIQDLQD